MFIEKKKYRDINNFFVAGISYKKTDAAIRGRYAINEGQYAFMIENAPLYGVEELFVLSTCNRTEVYAFAHDGNALLQLLCTVTNSREADIKPAVYIKNNQAALQHFFEVAAGLDSQILGDYEILGQVKTAIQFARERNSVGPYLERIISAGFRASKLTRTHTALSNGPVSVSFAAIRFIKENMADIAAKKILLVGTGKIGRSTCKNIISYLGTKNITLINRTPGKAAVLASELGLRHADPADMAEVAASADIIILATSSHQPVLLKHHLTGSKPKLVIDLAVPCNVEGAAQELAHIRFVNVDTLSKIKDGTLAKRKAAVPKARAIIAKTLDDFIVWHDRRTSYLLSQRSAHYLTAEDRMVHHPRQPVSATNWANG
ncbi:MAG: glutamyl-tRNA reductase [Ferruginibacter sp.]